ncbi:MAG: class I poly(R)-hydroxyalkanoic acid synthase [Hyphomicrobiales bacterium]|nr:class I poly(R)-hydroxyalkanoic acid synthase [Hyphomicrobiales bacterium]
MASHGEGGREFDYSAYTISNPEKLTQNMVRLFEVGSAALTRLMDDKKNAGPMSMAGEFGEAGKMLATVAQAWLTEPDKLAAAQAKFSQDFIELWGRTYRRMLGEDVEPLVKPAPGDARFQDPDWSAKPMFDFFKQAYLLATNWAETMVEGASGLDERAKQRARFNLNLITSALSPSNFPMTNPEVLRETAAQNGENLVKGMTQLVQDLSNSGDLLRIRQTDMSAFAVGRNLAVTPGKVIYQNDIIQLIQYAPTTPTVFATPLLIAPPWINKYYILDLTPQKSLIKWLVDQGFTVFVISWVNPDERMAQKSFESYMHEGVIAAADVVRQITGQPKTNALGYCVGGTLLATTLAYLAQTGKDPINAASFLTTQVDFARAGDLMIFINDTQVKALTQMMSERGYLDGSRMSAAFNMLRPKDLIWPYIVNNYLLGKQPFPFDLLYWNSDTTRMAASNHSFYLNEFYNLNKLAKGEMTIGGVRLDLSKVTLPIYELATKDDHIAPAASVFVGSKLFGRAARFVLAGSGHIAGVINPPDKRKYMYWTADENHAIAPTLEEWMRRATEHAGSWWPDYAGWLAQHSGERVEARTPGSEAFPPIEDAPGSYVKA